MNIKNQILLSVVISLVLGVVISASIFVSYLHMQEMQHQEDLAADVVKGGYELTYLANDYIVNAEPRARVQWEERYASLQPVISQLKAGTSEEARSIEAIRDYNEKIAIVFREIPDLQNPGTGSARITPVYQQITWSRNNVQSQGLIYEAWRLRHSYNNDVNEARDWNNVLVLALMVMMLATIVVNYLLISRRLVRSIDDVIDGSEVFATGKLDYRIPVTSDDEIGEIARRLNAMAERLHVVTASRDELDREIIERKRADDALWQANKKLNLLSSITRHDILNQVAILEGYLELAGDETRGPELQIYFNELNEAAQTIQRQIEFTKEYQEIGVNAATWQNVRDTVQRAGSVFKMETVTLTMNCGNVEIFADPLLQKVFHNLFDNAFRYAPPFTTITVTCEETENGLSVIFADDGSGITENVRKHLFERGFGKHTGLGLFLSREILAITGIVITENGEAGKGARFEMTVPKGAYRFSGAS